MGECTELTPTSLPNRFFFNISLQAFFCSASGFATLPCGARHPNEHPVLDGGPQPRCSQIFHSLRHHSSCYTGLNRGSNLRASMHKRELHYIYRLYSLLATSSPASPPMWMWPWPSPPLSSSPSCSSADSSSTLTVCRSVNILLTAKNDSPKGVAFLAEVGFLVHLLL